MGINYKKLWVLLIEKDITRAQRAEDCHGYDEQT